MSRASGGTATEGCREVAVAVRSERDRRLLAEALGDRCSVTAAEPEGGLDPADCYVVDDRTLDHVADDLAARKAAADPTLLPVLVLAGEQRRAERLLTGPHADVVDDVVVVPTGSALIRSRVDSLLERRTLSVRVDDEREQYRALAESADDAIVVFDDDNVARFANPAVEGVFGHAPDDIVGRRVTDLLVVPDPEAPVADPAAAAREERSPFETDVVTARHAEGHEFPVEVSVAPFERRGERRYTAVVRDVTEREARTTELERNRDLLARTQTIADVGGFEVDVATEELYWTDQVYEILGVGRGPEPTLEESFDHFHPDDHPLIREAVAAALHDQEPQDLELRIVRPSGEVRWVRLRGEPEVVDGEVVRLRGAIQDVTEWKQQQQRLERSRDMLARAQLIADVGGWEMDPETGALSWTEETYRIHGLPVGSDVTREQMMELVHPEDREAVEATFAAAADSGEPSDVEFRLTTPDGVRKWLYAKGEPVDRDGDPIVRGTVQNVTERKEREQDLERTVDLLSKTQAMADIGGWSVDPETKAVFWTDQVYDILGIDRGTEPSLEEALDHYHVDDRVVISAAIERALSERVPIDEELRVVRPSGEVRWVRVRGEPVTEDGEVTSLRGAFQDITDRKTRERELAENEQRFRAVFENATDAMVIADDDDGEYVAVNSAATELFGVPESELVGSTLFEFAADDHDADREWEAFTRGGTLTGELPLVRPDGTELTTRFAATPNILPGRHLVVLRDVTEQRARERELERYEAIVETAGDPVYVLDDEGTVALANDAFIDQFAGSREAVVGTSMADLIGPEESQRAARTIRSMLRAGDRQQTVRITLANETGRQRYYEVNVSVLRSDGEFTGTVGVAREVTDLVDRDQRLSVLDRVLRHNIRNKLNVILGHADTLSGNDTATVRATGDAIAEACEELLSLSDTARRFETAIEPGEARGPLNLTEHLPHVVEDVASTYPDATVSLEGDSDGSAWVRAHGALELAVEEVLDNAVVHCDRTPEVTVAVRDDPESGVVELRVADNGPGLDDVDREALERGLETPLEHMQGLGLWFVRWTVESSGGTLTLEENDPRGTVMVVRLPRTDPPQS